jgi:hypothetical protein
MKTIDNDKLNDIIWGQFGASIDMLERAILACPDEQWAVGPEFQQFWYLAYHTIFFLDYYLTDGHEAFQPRPPFGLTELDPKGLLPERVFTKEELLEYLAHDREKCRLLIKTMNAEKGMQSCPFPTRKMNNLEFLLYQMRHVQHHAAQLNLLLRQTVDDAPSWVSRSKIDLNGQ